MSAGPNYNDNIISFSSVTEASKYISVTRLASDHDNPSLRYLFKSKAIRLHSLQSQSQIGISLAVNLFTGFCNLWKTNV
jgi:hypothetical protein